MRWTKATEPLKGNHTDTLIVRFKGKKRLIENRYGEHWVWQTDREKEIRVYDNQWSELEYFDEFPPASAEDEAARLYPDKYKNGEGWAKGNHYMDYEIADLQRSAHITCARMYTGEIEKEAARIKELEEHLKQIYEMYGDEWTNYAQEWTEKVLRIKQST